MNTVVFDLGGVLVDWNPRYLLREVMPGREEEMETILADVLNHDWNLARDAGDSWPEAIDELVATYPQWADILRTFDARWPETIGGAHEDTVAILRELKAAGVPLYGLSNWSAEKFPVAEERFEWLRSFRGIVVSGRVHMVKPDAEIFEYLLDTYDLLANDIFFIDDHEPNVRSARAIGIHAHHYKGPSTLRADLVDHGFLS